MTKFLHVPMTGSLEETKAKVTGVLPAFIGTDPALEMNVALKDVPRADSVQEKENHNSQSGKTVSFSISSLLRYHMTRRLYATTTCVALEIRRKSHFFIILISVKRVWD